MLTVCLFAAHSASSKVAKLLVRDFHKTVGLWMDDVLSVRRVREGYLVRAGQFDMISNWKKTGAYTWEETSKRSKLFVKKHLRPRPAEIVAEPGIDWGVEWQLTEVSPTQTQVRRTVFRFAQATNRWLPLHLILPLGCADEHASMRRTFVARA